MDLDRLFQPGHLGPGQGPYLVFQAALVGGHDLIAHGLAGLT